MSILWTIIIGFVAGMRAIRTFLPAECQLKTDAGQGEVH